MPFSEVYRKQGALVVRALPEVAREDCFALKGGTGINLFIRDMPRLSVDIDLTYLPVQGREQSLAAIDAAMRRIEQGIKKSIRGSRTTLGVLRPEGHRDKTTGARRRRTDKDRSDAGSARLRVPGRTPRRFFKC